MLKRRNVAVVEVKLEMVNVAVVAIEEVVAGIDVVGAETDEEVAVEIGGGAEVEIDDVEVIVGAAEIEGALGKFCSEFHLGYNGTCLFLKWEIVSYLPSSFQNTTLIFLPSY